jgi:hypothetical protein
MPMLADSVKNLASFLIVAAILVAALHYGEDILVPMALAVILAFLLAPIVRALRRANIPHSAAVTRPRPWKNFKRTSWRKSEERRHLAGMPRMPRPRHQNRLRRDL